MHNLWQVADWLKVRNSNAKECHSLILGQRMNEITRAKTLIRLNQNDMPSCSFLKERVWMEEAPVCTDYQIDDDKMMGSCIFVQITWKFRKTAWDKNNSSMDLCGDKGKFSLSDSKTVIPPRWTSVESQVYKLLAKFHPKSNGNISFFSLVIISYLDWKCRFDEIRVVQIYNSQTQL